jgi:hypothetical protein
LGLIWFSREPVRDRLRYHVLVAQPEKDFCEVEPQPQ